MLLEKIRDIEKRVKNLKLYQEKTRQKYQKNIQGKLNQKSYLIKQTVLKKIIEEEIMKKYE